MKKVLLLIVLAVLISTCASSTFAQTATSSSRFSLASIKDRVASRAAALKLRLQNFQDQKKAQIVERLNDRLANTNQVRTGNMLKNLNKMSEILAKLESRVNGVSDQDTTAAKSAIADTRSKIASAEAAVKVQSDYQN